MDFIPLTTSDQLNEIDERSHSKLQILFKHSTRCSISRSAQKVLLSEMAELDDNAADIYYLDLLAYRDISNAIATRYNVRHESPQILAIQNAKCIYNASHGEVELKQVFETIK
jgi:bacillithiol system protein YtxJ